jgi:outer membrane protein assembly factor BamE (lipoprotein component of BamABCDE complex)
MTRRVSVALGILFAALVAAVGLVAWWLRPHTKYALGFSSEAFAEVQLGDPKERVLQRLGTPLSERAISAPERWCYGERPSHRRANSEGVLVSEYVFTLDGPPCIEFGEEAASGAIRDRSSRFGVPAGLTRAEVRTRFGEPTYVERERSYTVMSFSALDGEDGSCENVAVVLDATGVTEKIRQPIPD